LSLAAFASAPSRRRPRLRCASSSSCNQQIAEQSRTPLPTGATALVGLLQPQERLCSGSPLPLPLSSPPPLEPIRLGWSAACKRLCSADADFSQDCACSIRCTVLRTVQSMHRPAGNTTVRRLLCRKREEIGGFAPARHLLWLAATPGATRGKEPLA